MNNDSNPTSDNQPPESPMPQVPGQLASVQEKKRADDDEKPLVITGIASAGYMIVLALLVYLAGKPEFSYDLQWIVLLGMLGSPVALCTAFASLMGLAIMKRKNKTSGDDAKIWSILAVILVIFIIGLIIWIISSQN